MTETIYTVLQELWAKAVASVAVTPDELMAESKRKLVDDAAVKINAIIRGRETELPEIPRGKSLSLGKMPYFFLMPYPKGPTFKQWFVVGLAEDLPEGEAVEVNRYGDQEKQVVVIREHEYERVVHRGKENERRYVLASFDKEGW